MPDALQGFSAVRTEITPITPPDEPFLHTYYDVCPWSPSGRYFACLRLPFEDHHPEPDAEAEVCVFDRQENTCRTLCGTTAWGFQTAAKQQWGRTDRFLYFNIRRDSRPVGVRYDLRTGKLAEFEGPLWQVARDETFALSPCLIRANLTQPGYGISVPPEEQVTNTVTAAEDDGFFRLDLKTGENRLWLSLADVWQALPNKDELGGTILYAFHVKINPQGTRVALVVRAKPTEGKYHPMLLTGRPDASDLKVALPSWRWRQSRHANHPVWHPRGDRILMNVGFHGRSRFSLIDPDTGAIEPLIEKPEGGGHPTITPDERGMVTDWYDPGGEKTQTGYVRWVDLRSGEWRDLCDVPRPLIDTSTPEDVARRVDLHPVLDRDGRRAAFVAAPEGRRRLFVARLPD